MDDAWPEVVKGWELARYGHVERYRRRLANKVTVFATWDAGPGTGTVEARVDSFGLGRTLTRARKDFRDKEAFWTAAHCVVEIAANLPSLGAGVESPADSALFDTVAGYVHAEPGSSGEPDAELTFTLLSGRTVTLLLSDEQAFDLSRRIDGLDKHVWSEQRHDEEEESGGDYVVETPDVTEVRSGPDTGHDVVTLLDTLFGVTADHLMAHVDWSALIVVGEPAVSTLISRAAELETALHPRWYPVTLDRPGEQWVVLRRTGLVTALPR
ncbi:hypothetical protein ACFFQW_23475 [Umezawaea endophytica]|uniref:Uncharacterized protein n=1 Tax=Umezawaea endophytica TaxID=1654476 RepID=A0A9X2VSK1_9PSEU|nr:hypothetical protein [Umezawaea endophytica]MCS7480773.1 hypothetical protein [Umezawaea endophytica]